MGGDCTKIRLHYRTEGHKPMHEILWLLSGNSELRTTKFMSL